MAVKVKSQQYDQLHHHTQYYWFPIISHYLRPNAYAKPKAILDIMNVEGLTRDQVKSHLQVCFFFLAMK